MLGDFGLSDIAFLYGATSVSLGIADLVVGNGPGEVPLRKLVRHVSKLPRTLKPAQMTDVLARLKALDANRSNIPLPKGPVPTSMKGARQNMRGR